MNKVSETCYIFNLETPESNISLNFKPQSLTNDPTENICRSFGDFESSRVFVQKDKNKISPDVSGTKKKRGLRGEFANYVSLQPMRTSSQAVS